MSYRIEIRGIVLRGGLIISAYLFKLPTADVPVTITTRPAPMHTPSYKFKVKDAQIVV